MCCKAFIWFAMSDLLFFFSTFLYFCASGLSFIIANKNDFRWIISNYRSMLRKHLSLLYCTVFSPSFATFDCCKNFTKIDFQYFYFILETKYKSPSFFDRARLSEFTNVVNETQNLKFFYFSNSFDLALSFVFLTHFLWNKVRPSLWNTFQQLETKRKRISNWKWYSLSSFYIVLDYLIFDCLLPILSFRWAAFL